MLGKKQYQEKLFTNFQLSEYVPENNFYRRLKDVLDLDFLYKLTKPYYGSSGQRSIDPVVFFKMSLVGYLENIISDRKLVDHSSMRLDILYFLNYDIDEPLPWHSTISRTRQLFGEEIFEAVFNSVLQQCIDKGMVSGHTQAIDSAPVKANASMDSLEMKVPKESAEDHLLSIRDIGSMDKKPARRKAKKNRATKEQKTISASKEELQHIKNRNKNYQKEYSISKAKKSKFVSNKTHYSPTDPDARISVKPGKARKLNYLSQLSVDTGHHVITDIGAYHADKKDSQYLQDITLRLKQRLNSSGLLWLTLLSDASYSDGENYAFLERIGIKSFIPPHGNYKGGPKGFVYDESKDFYICPQGNEIPFKKAFYDRRSGTKKKEYRCSSLICKNCPIKRKCLSKSATEKYFTVTYYRAEYERNNKRVKSVIGRKMKALRSSTVEPVFGSLTQYFGMRKINTKGIKQANKIMQMAATAYNLKKLLKFVSKTAQSKKQGIKTHFYRIFHQISAQISHIRGYFLPLIIKIRFD